MFKPVIIWVKPWGATFPLFSSSPPPNSDSSFVRDGGKKKWEAYLSYSTRCFLSSSFSSSSPSICKKKEKEFRCLHRLCLSMERVTMTPPFPPPCWLSCLDKSVFSLFFFFFLLSSSSSRERPLSLLLLPDEYDTEINLVRCGAHELLPKNICIWEKRCSQKKCAVLLANIVAGSYPNPLFFLSLPFCW